MKSKAGQAITKYFLLIAIVILVIVFGALQQNFLSLRNIMEIVAATSVVGVMGLGSTFAFSCGELNFCLGSQATVVAVLLAKLLSGPEFNAYGLAIIIALAALLAFDYCVTTKLILYVGIPAFIGTLGAGKVYDAISYVFTGGAHYYSKYWPDAYSWAQHYIGGTVPVLAFVFIAIAIVAWIVLDKSKLGRHICAVGANAVACTQMGINVRRMKTIAMVISSFLAGVAGILLTSRNNIVTMSLGGELMMNAISATMLGATFLRPGRYSVQGTVVAALLVTIIDNGIVGFGAPSYFGDLVQGVILIIAVGYIAKTREGGLPAVKFVN